MDSTEDNTPKLTRIGKYDIIDQLGHGGMGVVYRAVDKHIGREVAIKTLTQGFMNDPGMLARFYDEGRRTGRLKHQNIVTVYDLGDDNGMPYIVMECVEGDPLDKLMKSDRKLLMSDRLKVIEDVCSALGYAHRNNVIHRDVKPANIFVQPDGTVKLLDFGIARLEKREQDSGHTRTGSVIGTVPYMAPERLLNGMVDARSDIFSAGVVLYQLVTEQLPFLGEDYVLMQKILNEAHPPLSKSVDDVPAGLEMIVDRALAKSPDERYSTAEEMAADLNSVIAELKLEQVHKLLPEARELMAAGDFTRARSVLQQLLKIQSKNTEARELLNEIQRQFTMRQREERVQQILRQARESFDGSRFDESLATLKEGLDLDTANQDLNALRERVLREKDKQERVNHYLQEADAARRKGDYKTAVAAAENALHTDQNNSRIVALCNVLKKEAEDAHRQTQANAMLESARAELASRRFTQAIALLKEVEQLDPTHPELSLLLGDASQGLTLARQRESVVKLEDQAAVAGTLEQLQAVQVGIQEAMERMPSEAALYRLNAEVERRLKEAEERRAVDETILACRELPSNRALELVRETRRKLPGDERLIALETMLDGRVRQQSADERREDYLRQARAALKSERYVDALQVLEMAQAEGIVTDETRSLAEFARSELAEQSRLILLKSNLAQAQTLIREGAWGAAVQFLEGALRQTEDSSLRLLLGQAVAGGEALRRQIETALALAGKLASTNRTREAIEYLQVQPPAVLASVRVQTALGALREQMQQAMFRMLGRAYALVDSDMAAGERAMQRVVLASGQSELTAKLAEGLQTRGREAADRVVQDVIVRCRVMLRDRDKAGAGELVQTVTSVAAYASEPVKGELQKLTESIAKTGLMGRLRR